MREGRRPPGKALRWVTHAIGSEIEAMQPLRRGHAPWRLRFRGRASDVLLRIIQPGWRNADPVRTNAAALQVAEHHGLAAPRLLAVDWQGVVAGMPATLETFLPGSASSPPRVSPARLRAFGAALARVHTVPLDPQPALPLLTRSKQYDHPMVRRWAALYRSSTERIRPDVLRQFCQLTGWPQPRARAAIDVPPGSPLLLLADERIRLALRPQGPSVFLHGDVWAGNALWEGDTCLALIDWKDAGVGNPGVDVSLLRLNMAVQYGGDAASEVLEGWQHAIGRSATGVAYWDVVAALNTPTIMDEPGFDTNGHLVPAEVTARRRDSFLEAALSALPG